MTSFLIFPHQLFYDNPLFILAEEHKNCCFYLIEYFDNSCKAKMRLHYASMLYYNDFLQGKGFQVKWIPSTKRITAIKSLNDVILLDPIEKDIKKMLKTLCKSIIYIPSPYFICTPDDIDEFTKKYNINRTNQETFYRWQRKRLNILMNNDKPIGGKWNYDHDNRENLRNVNINIPNTNGAKSKYYTYVDKHIKYTKSNYGDKRGFNYPCTHNQSKTWLFNFLKNKLKLFGKYQDAVVEDDDTLFHSVLSPMINCGLLTPQYVVDEALKYYNRNKKYIPLHSIEAFIRQIIGWREFIRILYEKSNIKLHNNFFNNNRKLPYAFYTGNTKIIPIDNMIKSVLRTGYAHHIIRLMWLGNFMLLCQIKPSDVNTWFMELFVDAYDWVMIPNVIGMSQYADGGIIATRPYFSTTNYLKSMSNFDFTSTESKKWMITWDALYGKFLNDKYDKLSKIYIVSNWARSWKNKSKKEKNDILKIANTYLNTL